MKFIFILFSIFLFSSCADVAVGVESSSIAEEANFVPVLSQSCSTNAAEDSAYSCTLLVSDTDSGDIQSYAFASNTCDFLVINSLTGVVSGTPDSSSPTSCAFSVQANDGSSNSNTETISLDVTILSMVSTWRVGDGGASTSITLPLRSGYSYNFTVDWGDGTSSTILSDTDIATTHNYGVADDYTVTISGTAEAWYCDNDTVNCGKLISIKSLGSLGWISLESAFHGAVNLTSFAGGNTSSVTNMASMFHDATSLTSLDLSSFDTSSVTGMASMFNNASSLTSLDFSNFDTSGVLSMAGMFRDTTSLVSLNIPFVTTSVTGMKNMFRDSSSLTSLNVSSFDTTTVTNMNSMFNGTSSLEELNVTNWDISNVTVSTDIFESTYVSLVVICNQDGLPGTGSFFGESCNI